MRVTVPHIHHCKKVLVAVDLYERHRFGTPYAYGLVQPGGIVRLVYNIMPLRLPNPMIRGYYQEYPSPKQQKQMIADAKAKLQDLAPPEARQHGIATEVEVTENANTAKAICAEAEQWGG